MPRVSVVVPAFENAPFIAATVRSVLSQRHSDFELIVADHASTDGTLARLAPFGSDPRLTVLHTPAGGGAEANWRRVSAAASGEYLKLLPGDDVLYPGALELQTRALELHPGAALVSSRRDVIDARGRVTLRGRGLQGVPLRPLPGVEAVRCAVRRGANVFGEPGCVLLRREALEAAGGWEARFPYLIDQLTYSKLLFAGGYVPLARTLAAFRVSSGQWSVALAGEQARQVAAYHAWCRAQAPEVISAADVRLGDRRARRRALARRAYYLLGARGMRVGA
ncbi:glycosyltransferase family 2 protein [Herbiconiux moechotypicola]|uniref:Glycosyltransferase 2-like domain-containing protein n=1 Tax=Herbiconiux moechotypicola TaxID=637393 RepID=A0ABN3DV80_9MICO|nr:glycosyltransferase family A protein [Herbiconiux moechotypicola]MCS5730990.1 glycosyltransferase family 2 protein [Herbiconiux moechotypicola]